MVRYCADGIASAFIAASLTIAASPCRAQTNFDLATYFRLNVGLSSDQIASIEQGKPVTKELRPRTPAELFLFGATYVNAQTESCAKASRDPARMREFMGSAAVHDFSHPPRLADLDGFSFESQDIKALRECKPGACGVQMPAAYIEDLRQSVDWSAPDPGQQINDILRRTALEKLVTYEQQGNRALGVYHDKEHPFDVPKQFHYMLSYSRALPKYAPKFYSYLLDYPRDKPPHTDDRFYWANVNFGFKPTLRIVHQITMEDQDSGKPAYAIAEKQLYASHYFQSAVDLTFCIPHPTRDGFYLVRTLGSEQAGLTGFKGSMIRKKAVSRSLSSLNKSLANVKSELEQQR